MKNLGVDKILSGYDWFPKTGPKKRKGRVRKEVLKEAFIGKVHWWVGGGRLVKLGSRSSIGPWKY